jgi:hypothetical protein
MCATAPSARSFFNQSRSITRPFKAHLAAQGDALRGYVEQEFEDYLQCGRLEQGFLRVRSESCHFEWQ